MGNFKTFAKEILNDTCIIIFKYLPHIKVFKILHLTITCFQYKNKTVKTTQNIIHFSGQYT